MNKIFTFLIVPALMGCNREITHERQFVGPDTKILARYYLYLEEGNDPTQDRRDRLQARAMEMVEILGLPMRADSEIWVAAVCGVPVQVKLDGQEILIEDLYTPAEKARLTMAHSLKAMLAK